MFVWALQLLPFCNPFTSILGKGVKMFDRFEASSVLIAEIESIADMDLRDIKCIYLDEEDSYETTYKDTYIWDLGEGNPHYMSLETVRTLLDTGYTAIPF